MAPGDAVIFKKITFHFTLHILAEVDTNNSC